MIATAYIAAAAQINLSYSPGGTNAQPHLLHGYYTSMPAPKRHLDRFSRFCTAHGSDQHTDRARYVTTSAVTAHISAGDDGQ